MSSSLLPRNGIKARRGFAAVKGGAERKGKRPLTVVEWLVGFFQGEGEV